MFDHEIPINLKSGITILIGENGLGKTVLLESVNAFFKSNFSFFESLDFEELIFQFIDDKTWVLSKTIEKPGQLQLVEISKKNKQTEPFYLHSLSIRERDYLLHRISRFEPFIRRDLAGGYWIDRRTSEKLNAEQLIQRFGKKHLQRFTTLNEDKPKWFIEKFNNEKINLIETQRLIHIKDREAQHPEITIEKYSKELSDKIKSLLTESAELSSKLDRTYPDRLINMNLSANVTEKELNSELEELEKKRALLDAVGLIEIEKHSGLTNIKSRNKMVRQVLMLYAKDSFKKMEIFNEISRKIELFLNIINKRFKHKRLYVDKDLGFLLKSTIIKEETSNQIIPITKLSSGEQNELVLFYILIFKTIPESLILIDEPELSLHISWQNNFITDLKEILALIKLDVIIATHSPDIIGNNWDLRVELKGLE